MTNQHDYRHAAIAGLRVSQLLISDVNATLAALVWEPCSEGARDESVLLLARGAEERVATARLLLPFLASTPLGTVSIQTGGRSWRVLTCPYGVRVRLVLVAEIPTGSAVAKSLLRALRRLEAGLRKAGLTSAVAEKLLEQPSDRELACSEGSRPPGSRPPGTVRLDAQGVDTLFTELEHAQQVGVAEAFEQLDGEPPGAGELEQLEIPELG